MSRFEMDLASINLLLCIWYRYVDDIYAVIKKTDVQNTLNKLNSQNNTIKFNIEEECDQKLAFLDICVGRKSNAFKFTIHRKPRSTNRYLKLSSFHVLSQKSAAFFSTANSNRLINVPMTEKDYQTEKNNIIQFGQLNGYNETFTKNIIEKHERRKYHNSFSTMFTSPNSEPERIFSKIFSLPFHSNLTKSLSKLFATYEIRVIESSSNNYKIKTTLKLRKPKFPSSNVLASTKFPVRLKDVVMSTSDKEEGKVLGKKLSTES
jgi:hypothetical protein